MSEKTIDRIIDETSFSMEVEGFLIPEDEKAVLRKVLNGDISFSEQLKKYIDEAVRVGGSSNA